MCELKGHQTHIYKGLINSLLFQLQLPCLQSSCILPCSFQSGADPVIIWIQLTAGLPLVHYYDNKDQLGLQDQHFRNRTSLFKDQISRGNASLQLTGVEEESFINLRVDVISYPYAASTSSFPAAPVSKVNMEQVGNRIICSSEGIYPEPDLTWSTRPPSNLNLQNQTSIQQTEQQLYNISSSLILSDSETDLIYICTISTHKGIYTSPNKIKNTAIFVISVKLLRVRMSFREQLGLQDQFFRGRTSLFKDQISRGNASLQLTGVEVQDQGRYRCHTMISYPYAASTSSFLAAPVSKVNMEQVGNRIICSSEGIYPEPDLTWSTRPPSNLNLQNQPTIQQTEQQLYNISSSLILSDSETDLIYICTISTHSNSRNTTWRKPHEDYISPVT
uniref:Ig-like domain-containing protein n=1 Tax=Lates calcarifer TaxID=8187 RepID=A0A4W6G5A1_LATCA